MLAAVESERFRMGRDSSARRMSAHMVKHCHRIARTNTHDFSSPLFSPSLYILFACIIPSSKALSR